MNNSTLSSRIAWSACAAMAAFMIFSGFQSGQEKTAVVDMNKAIADSKLGKKNVEDLSNLVNSRQALLTFLDNNRIATQEQATKLRTLALKGAALTPAEQQDNEKVKGEITASTKAYNDLNQKPSPTDQDRIQLQDYNQRQRTIIQLLQAWQEEFTGDLNQRQIDMRRVETSRASESLAAVAKKGAFTVVLERQFAPFGANDLTADVIKDLDSKP